jgi:hypothetical protein
MGYEQRRQKQFVSFRVYVCAMTDKSVCLARTKEEVADRKGTWFPVSQCDLPTGISRGDYVDVGIADWLAEKEGWE